MGVTGEGVGSSVTGEGVGFGVGSSVTGDGVGGSVLQISVYTHPPVMADPKPNLALQHSPRES